MLKWVDYQSGSFLQQYEVKSQGGAMMVMWFPSIASNILYRMSYRSLQYEASFWKWACVGFLKPKASHNFQ